MIVDRSLPENAGKVNYRDVALFFQDEDNIIGTSFMPYVQNVAGIDVGELSVGTVQVP